MLWVALVMRMSSSSQEPLGEPLRLGLDWLHPTCIMSSLQGLDIRIQFSQLQNYECVYEELL